jgi:hypothetical protein
MLNIRMIKIRIKRLSCDIIGLKLSDKFNFAILAETSIKAENLEHKEEM